MAIPRFSDFFPVVLNEMYDTGGVSSYKILRQKCIDKFSLTEEELAEQLPSGQSRLSNRIYWTISYCRMAGLVATVENERGKIKLTDDGLSFVKAHGTDITLLNVKACPKYIEHQNEVAQPTSNESTTGDETLNNDDAPGEEAISKSVNEYNTTLSAELMQEIRTNLSDDDFEALCVKLLIKMGYGKPELNQDSVTPHSGDGGIDGIIKGDPLGFNSIYLQAKKYADDNKVGPRLIREFVGAMSGKRNGAFITTSKFTPSAVKEAERNIDKHIVLIDGPRLLKYMIEYGLGVQTIAVHEIKKVDHDFFNEPF